MSAFRKSILVAIMGLIVLALMEEVKSSIDCRPQPPEGCVCGKYFGRYCGSRANTVVGSLGRALIGLGCEANIVYECNGEGFDATPSIGCRKCRHQDLGDDTCVGAYKLITKNVQDKSISSSPVKSLKIVKRSSELECNCVCGQYFGRHCGSRANINVGSLGAALIGQGCEADIVYECNGEGFSATPNIGCRGCREQDIGDDTCVGTYKKQDHF